jgi:hypothetical protein
VQSPAVLLIASPEVGLTQAVVCEHVPTRNRRLVREDDAMKRAYRLGLLIVVVLMLGCCGTAPAFAQRDKAAAQDCPTAQSGRLGFVVERGDRQKSGVFH